MIKQNKKYLEKRLREEIRKAGGLAIKFTSPYFTGMPDRLVLMPKGRIWFVEVKSTGKRLKDIQEAQAKKLRELGFNARLIDTKTDLDSFIEDVMG